MTYGQDGRILGRQSRFDSRMIERKSTAELGETAEIDHRSCGVMCTVKGPMPDTMSVILS